VGGESAISQKIRGQKNFEGKKFPIRSRKDGNHPFEKRKLSDTRKKRGDFIPRLT